MGLFKFSLCALLSFSCCCGPLLGEDAGPAPDPDPLLNYHDALVYGLVEGVTEFLPVSSTGHLILAKHWMTQQDRPEAMTALHAYLIVIQAGAILAVSLLYWREIWAVMLGLVGLDPRGRALGSNLLVAFLPAAALGPFLDGFIEELLFSPVPVAFALASGALLMLWAERKRSTRVSEDTAGTSSELDQMSSRSALLIGLMQCVAMWPGTSRSMMTIVGGYLVGLRPVKAAEFSFLLGLVTLSSAAGYKVVTQGGEMMAQLEMGPVLVGCFVAGISAALSVRWLVSYLTRRGLGLFAWYRLLLAAFVLAFA